MSLKAEKLVKKFLGTDNIKSVQSRKNSFIKRYKIVVFVPLEKTDELAFAIASAGAGVIGNYTVCSFRTKGVGTFMGNEQSMPKAGTKEKFEMVEEIRLEMICDKKNLKNAVDKMYEVHPYDEPAFEIYEVLTVEKPNGQVTVELKKKTAVKQLLKKINPELNSNILPKELKKLKIKKCIIDISNNNNNELPKNLPKGILYIRKNKKNLKAYLT